jgi:hypothetical protein
MNEADLRGTVLDENWLAPERNNILKSSKSGWQRKAAAVVRHAGDVAEHIRRECTPADH